MKYRHYYFATYWICYEFVMPNTILSHAVIDFEYGDIGHSGEAESL